MRASLAADVLPDPALVRRRPARRFQRRGHLGDLFLTPPRVVVRPRRREALGLLTPPARLDARHGQPNRRPRLHQHGRVDDAVLLRADQFLAVQQQDAVRGRRWSGPVPGRSRPRPSPRSSAGPPPGRRPAGRRASRPGRRRSAGTGTARRSGSARPGQAAQPRPPGGGRRRSSRSLGSSQCVHGLRSSPRSCYDKATHPRAQKPEGSTGAENFSARRFRFPEPTP